MRQQRSYIWKAGRSWFGRWREDSLLDGQVVRKQRCAKLADVCDRYRSKADVYPLLAEKLRPINEGRHSPQSTMPVATFVEHHYLPVAKENCRPSTYAAYKTQWESYLAPRLQKIILRDFRTVDAANLLADIYRCHGLSRSTLRHLKAFMSTVFGFAKNQGVLDGVNPIRDTAIPKKAPLDTTTPVGKMIYTVLGSVSELERCLTVERVRAGMRNAAAKGRHIGRPALRQFSNAEREEIRITHRNEGTSVRQLAIRFRTTQWMMSRILRGQYVGS